MIILAVYNKNNKYVYAYNEKKEIILKEYGELYNYTNDTVAIKKNNNIIVVFNESRKQIATYPHDFNFFNNIVDPTI